MRRKHSAATERKSSSRPFERSAQIYQTPSGCKVTAVAVQVLLSPAPRTRTVRLNIVFLNFPGMEKIYYGILCTYPFSSLSIIVLGVRGRAFSETLAGWQKSCRQADSEILRLWYSRNNVGGTDEYIQSQHEPSAG